MSTLRISHTLLILLTATALTACLGGSGGSSSRDRAPDFSLATLSSAPDQVSGGDVLVTIEGDREDIEDELSDLEFWVNDQQQTPLRTTWRNGRLEVLLDGLEEGENQLELHHDRHGRLDSLTLVNHSITGPIFSGPHQYPFVCTTVSELGIQPLVDTDGEMGFPVLDEGGQQIGLSKDCSIEPVVTFLYRTTGGAYRDLPTDGSRPADMARTTLTDGREVDFIVRREVGTINRFIYSMATLANLGDAPDTASTNNWNGRLLYHFEGGVAIGHSQGRLSGRALSPEALGQGYAVIYSTGNRTSTHYNLQVGGETALMVKEHFIKRFGVPDYTVAIGGSGGAIQQYVYAQNHPGLIDAGVPQYSYPDMVTQTIHIGDCELLEHYMDVTDKDNTLWTDTLSRRLLVGLNATEDYPDPFAGAKGLLGLSTAPGMTECIPAWRGLSPLVMNPLFGQAPNQDKMQPPGIMNTVQWSHYDDLRNIYGVDENGNPRTLYDNVGVQYGLQALVEGNITPDEFLRVNALIGGWKHPNEMVQEGFPFLGSVDEVLADPSKFDPWSSRNMNLSPDGVTPAPRTQGDLIAINAAYESGMVFDGQLDIPIIDWRHYLEEVLDMHNSHQSFSARQRIRNRMGHSDNQVIWFTDARPTILDDPEEPEPRDEFDQTWMALEVLHEWLMNIRANPDRSIGENRPAAAVDSCFNTQGELIASGADVWDGILDDRPAGSCTQQFPTYTTSRIIAGGPIEGSVFKCTLKSVDTALADGTYGSWVPTPGQVDRLKEIFPQGVCDYSKPDQGRPGA
ncbi:MAG: hypothetical protein GX789_14670 [Pseudomonas formosensis]|nr:hypothetical protein [Halopseudomonas formosensis]